MQRQKTRLSFIENDTGNRDRNGGKLVHRIHAHYMSWYYETLYGNMGAKIS